jgi:hemerythrin-like metal-binding protein
MAKAPARCLGHFRVGGGLSAAAIPPNLPRRMRTFALTSSLLTGIPAIDEQHCELFDLANEVVDDSASDLHPELFRMALGFLEGYIAYHFAAEEVVMSELGYPESAAHADLHARLQNAVAAMLKKAAQQGPSEEMKAELKGFLQDWVVHHVREADFAMARYVRDVVLDVKSLSLPGVLVLKSRGSIPADFDDRFAAGMAGLRPATK